MTVTRINSISNLTKTAPKETTKQSRSRTKCGRPTRQPDNLGAGQREDTVVLYGKYYIITVAMMNQSHGIPSVWLAMTQRVATLSIFFSRRSADTATVDTPLSPHCLRVCSEIYETASGCLHCPIRPVIVGPFLYSFAHFTVLNAVFRRFCVLPLYQKEVLIW